MSNQVGNSEDRFSRDESHLITLLVSSFHHPSLVALVMFHILISGSCQSTSGLERTCGSLI